MTKVKLATNLATRVKNYIDIASEYEYKLSDFEMADALGEINKSELMQEHWELQEPFDYYMVSILRDLKSLSELLGLNSLLSELDSFSLKHKDKLAEFSFNHTECIMHSEVLLYCERVFSSISSTLRADVSSGLDTFKTILKNTPMILKDSETLPKNETEVSKQVFRVLNYAFLDAIRPKIPQLTKTYIPDLGVIGLKAAAEYKFITSLEELKNSIGGIYEDMHGYAGSADWEIFFSVFYISCTIPPVEKILSEFEITKTPRNWHHIFVYGPNSKH